MSIKDNFIYCILEFDKIINALENAGIDFDWYNETPPNLAADGREITQQLIIEKPGFYFVMNARETRTGAQLQEAHAPDTYDNKIISFPAKHII